MATTAIPHGQYIDLALSENVVTVGEIKKALSEKLSFPVDKIHIVYQNHHDIPDNEQIYHGGKLHFVHINRQLLYGLTQMDKFTFVMTTDPHVVGEDGKVKAITIYSKDKKHPDLTFETIRLSCESDKSTTTADFSGFILYGYKPSGSDEVKTDWRLGGKHCRSAYMVIQSTSSPGVSRYIGNYKAPGMVHGAVYWNVFGENANPRQAEGEGFSVKHLTNSKITNPWNSGVFNANPGAYHGSKKEISTLGHVIVKHIINKWQKNPAVIGSTYSVGEILSGAI